MIFHKHKLIFIHIPKNAGTSIEKALDFKHNRFAYGMNHDHRTLRQYTPFHILPTRFIPVENLEEILHHAKLKIESYFHPTAANTDWLNAKNFSQYTTFSVVRNPWSRVYSWYNNVIADDEHRKAHGIAPDETPSLKEFLQEYPNSWGLKPQLYWLKDFNGKIGVDYICYQERLQMSFNKLAEQLNLPSCSLPHAYKGRAPSYLEAYDKESKKIVAERYAKEIDLFGYHFSGLTHEKMLLEPPTTQTSQQNKPVVPG